ncbi:uncharacterized protein [Malus domestica]|uniref:uncharacterized protein n=1 Tax=Malus domestica TaxID=3750 RepID=UPI0007ECC882|nr:uncharacterized protein LOC108170002 [Malus domestica]
MEVFYPLVDVHPFTRTLDKLWDADRSNKDHLFADKKPPSSLLFPWPGRIFSFLEEMNAQRRSSSFELMTYSRRCLRYQIQLLLHHPRVKTHPSPFQKLGVVRFYVSITTCGVRHSLFHLALGSDLRNQVQFYLDCQNTYPPVPCLLGQANLDSPTSLAFPQRFYLIMQRELSPHQTSKTERPWQWVCRKQIKQQLKAEKR